MKPTAQERPLNTPIPRRRFLMIMPAVLAVFLVACGGSGSRGGGGGSGGGGSSPTTIVPFGTKQMGVAGVVTDGNSVATD